MEKREILSNCRLHKPVSLIEEDGTYTVVQYLDGTVGIRVDEIHDKNGEEKAEVHVEELSNLQFDCLRI